MKWVEIKEDNRYDLIHGDSIKYFNGNDWIDTNITDYEMDYGIIKGTNITLIKPEFGDFVFVLK